MSDFAPLPEPPYYAVIFTAQRSDADEDGYGAMAVKMSEMALAHPGCIGMESARDSGGLGITVSYWTDEASLLQWKRDTAHLVAQQIGKDRWYSHYTLRVAKVERSYSGPEGR